MKLTKARINKAFSQIQNTNQTRKKFKNKKILTHTNTYKNRPINAKQSNSKTLKKW
jgi:hypothetical protein